MGSHLTPSPCLAGIWLVPILFPLWLFIVQFIGFRALSPSLAHIHNALLGGHRAQPPCQAATGYKPSQKLSNCTKILQNLLNGKKILQIQPEICRRKICFRTFVSDGMQLQGFLGYYSRGKENPGSSRVCWQPFESEKRA